MQQTFADADHSRWRWLCLMLLAWLTTQANASGSPESIRERFLREAPPAWKEYQRRAADLQGSYGDHTQATVGKLREDSHAEYKRNETCRLLVIRVETSHESKKTFRERAYGVNPQYAFELRRTRGHASWVLVALTMLNQQDVPTRIEQAFHFNGRALSPLVWYDNDSLVELVQKPEFRITDCHTIQHDGEELVEVRFVYNHQLNAREMLEQDGLFLLDPKRYWCLRSYEVRRKTPDVAATEKLRDVEFESSAGSLPIVKRLVLELDAVAGPKAGNLHNKRLSRGEYKLEAPAKLPGDDEFRLTAFGLSEPPGVEWKKPTPWWLWGILIAVVCLLGGAVFTWLKRRAA